MLTNTYDAVGNRDSLADSLGGSATYDHDGAGRLAQLITASSQQIDLTYDNAGRPDLIQFPNGTTTDHDYDTSGRLMALAHDDGATDLAVFGYSYDPAGNILAIAELADTKSYSYDELQRLVTGGTGAAPESYGYDAVGNRTTGIPPRFSRQLEAVLGRRDSCDTAYDQSTHRTCHKPMRSRHYGHP